MKTNFRFLTSLFMMSFVLLPLGCKQSSLEPSSETINLLSNGSFETNNTPTLDGWRFGNEHLAQVINEAPANGGNWSLQLTSDWAPTTGYVYTPVSGVKSGEIVRLSAYVRGVGLWGGSGIIMISVGPAVFGEHTKSVFSTDTVWNQISLTDTLTLGSNDTVWVILSSPITEIAQYKQLFDLVTLKKVSN
jgi:hypothetical protein